MTSQPDQATLFHNLPSAPGDRERAAGSFNRRRWLAFLGPATLVSVGYMDPGNWATDLEGGARFGYQLLWVLVLSNLMALLLQSLSAKLGIVAGMDLASACRAHYSKGVSAALWVLAELAIIACDLAEVLGSAIALNLLFGVPLVMGAIITVLDVFLILALQRRGARTLEALVLTLLITIAVCLGVELLLVKPVFSEVTSGLVPKLDGASLYVAIGILGATVMPHNLYLHSALVPQRLKSTRPSEQRQSLRRSFWSTALALNLALLLNAAILILAAAVFSTRGIEVSDLREAQRLLAPLVGTSAASILFAVGLLCSGQSATITGTLAGQIVMEGFVRLRVSPVVRRMITRSLAIIPAVLVLSIVGADGTMSLLIASQVVLSLQLPFAVLPLIRLTSSKALMGGFVNGRVVRVAAWACAVLVTSANVALVSLTMHNLRESAPLLSSLLAGAAIAGLGLLGWVCFVPLRAPRRAPTLPAA